MEEYPPPKTIGGELIFRLLALCFFFIYNPDPSAAHDELRVLIKAREAQLKVSPKEPQLYLERGELYRKSGNWKEALQDYETATHLDASLSIVDLARGKLWFETGDFAKSLNSLNRYLWLSPADPHGRIVRARVWTSLGRHGLAAEDFRTALENPRVRRPQIFLETADALVHSSSNGASEAIRVLDEGIKSLGNLPTLQLKAIDLEISLGNLEAALSRLSILEKNSARKEKWLLKKGELLSSLGRWEEAYSAFKNGLSAVDALPAHLANTPATLAVRSRLQTGYVASQLDSDLRGSYRESVPKPGSPGFESPLQQTEWLIGSTELGSRRPTPASNTPKGPVPPTVLRGPYLQTGTPTSVIVKWRTDVPADSRVRYGTAMGELNLSAEVIDSVTDHEVALTGLAPDTRYYYSIGTSAEILAGSDETHFFVTSPPAGAPKATRVWVLGDSGTKNANARAVRDAYFAFTGERHTDLWLMLGDNAYVIGSDDDYQSAVFEMYPTMLRKSVLWPTLGNHDGITADSATESGPYYDIFSLPKNGGAGGLPTGTEAYYSFDYANIHFICLDSFETDRSPGGAMMTWLENDLADTTQDWIIAFWHHPPYSKGSHDSDFEPPLVQMRENALPILEAGGADLVLAGHSHSYERSYLMNGHFGASDTLLDEMIIDRGDGRFDGDGSYRKLMETLLNEGTVYTVAGSSGQISGGSLDHPAMFVSLNVLGSMALDIQGPRLDALFIDSEGNRLDYFRIQKGSSSGVVEWERY